MKKRSQPTATETEMGSTEKPNILPANV